MAKFGIRAARTLLACCLAALSALPAAATDFTKGDIKITQPWARATPGGAKVAAGYLTLTNTGKTPDRLIGGTALAAGTLEIHDMTMTDGVMRMRRLETGIEIKPGATVALKPGSIHVMFMDLKQPFTLGEKVKGTLMFEKAGSVEIEYEVAPIGAQSPAGGPAKAEQHKNH